MKSFFPQALALVLLLASPLRAAELHISVSGDDASGSGTAASPWRTLEHGVAQASPGDLLLLHGDQDPLTDDFSCQVTIPQSKAGLHLLGQAEGGAGPRLRPLDPAVPCLTILADEVEVQGLVIHGQTSNAAVVLGAGTRGVQVLDSSLPPEDGDKNSMGVQILEGAEDFVLENLEIRWAVTGIQVSQSGAGQQGFRIRSCRISQASDCLILEGATRGILEDNTLEGCTRGIRLQSCSGLEVRGNQISNSGMGGIETLQGIGNNLCSNRITGANNGILVSSGDREVLADNELESCTRGMNLESSTFLVVAGNRILGSQTRGIETNMTSSNLFLGNLISGSGGVGLLLPGTYNLLINNEIIENTGPGIQLGGGNTLFLNLLGANQGGPVTGAQVSTWSSPVDLTYLFGDGLFSNVLGNRYEGSYSGFDDGSGEGLAGDGVGDTDLPMTMDGQQDDHPLTGAPDQYRPDLRFLSSLGELQTLDQLAWDQPLDNIIRFQAWESRVFATPEQAQGALLYPAGESGWSYGLRFRAKPNESQTMRLEVGWLLGGEFFKPPQAPALDLDCPGLQTTWYGTMEPGDFFLPKGVKQALRITRMSGSECSLVPTMSFLAPSMGSGLFPGPGLEPAILLEPQPLDLGELLFGQTWPGQITLTNQGDTTLTIAQVTFLGPDQQDLVLTAASCLDPETGAWSPLEPGQDCSLELSFTPQTGGLKENILRVDLLEEGALPAVGLITAIAGPRFELVVEVLPPELGLVQGNGLECTSQCSTLLDLGTEVSLAATPTQDSVFLEWEGCPEAQDQICSFEMDQDRQVRARFRLKAPKAEVSPGEVEFGEVELDSIGDEHLVILKNQGDKNLELTAAEIPGTAGANFLLTNCGLPATIEPQGQCELRVSFAPQVQGEVIGELVITTSDPENQVIPVALHGTGLARPRTLRVAMNPPEGGRVWGDGIDCPGDCEETFPGTATVTLNAEAQEGYRFSGWTGTGCSQASCPLVLEQDLAAVAHFTALQARLSLNTDLLDLGASAPGTASDPGEVIVTNTGDSPLEVSGLDLGGSHGEEFSITEDTCSAQPVEPQQTCRISLTLTPGTPGTRGGWLDLTSNGTALPARLYLRGSGTGTLGWPDPQTELDTSEQALTNPEALAFYTRDNRQVQLTFYLRNLTDQPVGEVSLVLEGEDPDQFGLGFEKCTGATVDSGKGCQLELEYIPSEGRAAAAAELVAKTGSGQTWLTIPLVGLNTLFTPYEEKEPGIGCGVQDRTSSSNALILLMIPLLLLSLRRASVRAAQALVILAFLGAGGCNLEGGGVCMGDMEISATGGLDPLNRITRSMVGASSFTCGEVALHLVEDVPGGGYASSEYAALSLYLRPPLYIGREYGAGTHMFMHVPGMLAPLDLFVCEGSITVTDVTYHRQPEACVNSITLEFDFKAYQPPFGLPGWDELIQCNNPSTLKGTATYNYGTKGYELVYQPRTDGFEELDCLPPHLESTLVTSRGLTGQDINPPGLEEDDLEALESLPVARAGTESNLVSVIDRGWFQADGRTVPAAGQVQVTVTPDPNDPTGNRFCPVDEENPYAWRCPEGFKFQPFTLSSLPAVMLDVYGLAPELDLRPEVRARVIPPAISSPQEGAQLWNEDPLVLTWDPGEPEGGLIHLTMTGDTRVLVDMMVEDSGLLELDPGLLADFSGGLRVELTRHWDFEDPFNLALAPGSSATFERTSQVNLLLSEGSSSTLGEELNWTEPYLLSQEVIPEPFENPVPAAIFGPDNNLLVAWLQGEAGAASVKLQSLDLSTLTWTDLSPIESGYLNGGPLGLDATEDGILLWGNYRDFFNGFRPAKLKLDWDGTTLEWGMIPSVESRNSNWPFAGALLTEGVSLNLFTNPSDRQLMKSLGMEQPEPVALNLDQAPIGGPELFHLPDGGILFDWFFAQKTTAYIWRDPVLGPIEEVPLGLAGRYCFASNAMDAEGLIHLVCTPSSSSGDFGKPFYTTADPMTGEVKEEELPYTTSPLILDHLLERRIAAGPQGVWVLDLVEWEGLGQVFLHHRESGGTWDGPWILKEPVTTALPLVDSAGRLHLIYFRADKDTGLAENRGLYHIMTEVAP